MCSLRRQQDTKMETSEYNGVGGSKPFIIDPWLEPVREVLFTMAEGCLHVCACISIHIMHIHIHIVFSWKRNHKPGI